MTRPLLFLDIDDVLCLNEPYGGYHVLSKAPPADLHARLFSAQAVQTLLAIVAEHRPQAVISSSWVDYMQRQKIVRTLQGTGLGAVADSLHAKWRTHQRTRMTRLIAIGKWLELHHRDEPFVVLDDFESGTGLRGSALDQAGRVVLCDGNVGLHAGHLPAVRAALMSS